ncbi:ABC transporter permease [Labrys wisconsinensis]|uniref:ABC-type spermidine/putrescine transport system permease subunit II n=1 Tax=Labrys wisconsinensis TaxID=425677 RepID=A0ABU0J9W5_9HYPH|nr:ABC transporter permease [Labrys wisconsinensis]MDQ0471057.1 ABC-type spermidine/putrescine transport system permease subunit II [Labrys wisconsinensis]
MAGRQGAEGHARATSAAWHRPRATRLVSRGLAVLFALVVAFLCGPAAIVVSMSFSSASSLQFPPPGLSLRWYAAFLTDPGWLAAVRTSFAVAFVASVGALIVGSLGAYGLVRGSFRGRSTMAFNAIAPLMVPHIVLAIALYILFARTGLLGTLTGLMIAHTVLAVPYVVLVMTAALRAFDVRLEQAAYTLGASWRVFVWRILLPNLLPSLAIAWIFAFATSFDEVTVTVFLAGPYETVPKRMFSELMVEVDPIITVVASLTIALSLIGIAAMAPVARRLGMLPLGHALSRPSN